MTKRNKAWMLSQMIDHCAEEMDTIIAYIRSAEDKDESLRFALMDARALADVLDRAQTIADELEGEC